jgi:hypothetical protein
MAMEFEIMEGAGILRDRWNGPAKRERHSAQRKAWKHAKETKRADQFSRYDKLMEELTSGNLQRKESLDRTKHLEDEIKEIRKNSGMSLPSDLRSKVQELQEKCSHELQIRRDWSSRRQKIESTLQTLKGGELSGARLNGRRPIERPSNLNPGPVPVNSDDVDAQHDSDLDVLAAGAASGNCGIAGSDIDSEIQYASEAFGIASNDGAVH